MTTRSGGSGSPRRGARPERQRAEGWGHSAAAARATLSCHRQIYGHTPLGGIGSVHRERELMRALLERTRSSTSALSLGRRPIRLENRQSLHLQDVRIARRGTSSRRSAPSSSTAAPTTSSPAAPSPARATSLWSESAIGASSTRSAARLAHELHFCVSTHGILSLRRSAAS